MPLKHWIHPVSGDRVDLDHFDTDDTVGRLPDGSEGRPAFPPWAANFVRKNIELDVRHTGLAITATGCLGCPRSVALERLFDFAANPVRRFVMDRGTMLHSVAAANWPEDNFISEGGAQKALLTVNGTLFGEPVSALLDCIRIDPDDNGCPIEIIDLKFPLDWSVRYRKRVASDDNTAQLNIQRLLLAQQPWAQERGFDGSNVLLTIWNHALGKNEGPIAQRAAHMSEEALTQFQPGGGKTTIREIVQWAAWIRDSYAELSTEDKLSEKKKQGLVAQMPLTGVDQFNSNRCLGYCDVEKHCSKIVREYGDPNELVNEEVDYR